MNTSARRWCLLALFGIAAAAMVGRVVYLQILNKDFLIDQGEARSMRTVTIPAHRGMITDRNNEPLAVSTPVASVWALPKQLLQATPAQLESLAGLLETPAERLRMRLTVRQDKEFVYLKRHIQPQLARRVRALNIAGVNIRVEYKRYYPTAEVTAHLIGFTDIDDHGQEGLELALDEQLRGAPGQKRVLRDRYGSVVRNIENIRQPAPGATIALSIDKRLQYLAYRELEGAVMSNRAKGAMLVLLDVRSGEVLALVVQPSFNPNNRAMLSGASRRNRVLTDVFEPGSTIKPFTIAAALLSGEYHPQTMLDTTPGSVRVGGYTISDLNDYGRLSISDVIKKSSNVGATMVAMSLGAAPLWQVHDEVGFGKLTGSGYPGEVSGILKAPDNWSRTELATMSYGYGLSVTALQLAQAYATVAAEGLLYPVSFLRADALPAARRALPQVIAFEINKMMRTVIGPGGSGRRAAVDGYHVAGKTGTVHKASSSGYSEANYYALFAGFAPATDPALALVVVVDDPQAGRHFGGQVAAPVFAAVMRGALRMMNIPPDNPVGIKQRIMPPNNMGAGA